MRAFGAGGPMIRTELSVPNAQPGGKLHGEIEVTGGDHAVNVGYIALALMTPVRQSAAAQEFHRCQVHDGFRLAPGERLRFPVTCEVPWEAPLTMPGVNISLRTELEVAMAVDRSDTDEVTISPFPAQQRILDAVHALGFQFGRSHVERGTLPGVPQTLPFYQEIEFFPGQTHSHYLNQLEVTFVANQDRLYVVLECDRRVSVLADRDVFGRFVVDPASIQDTDWQGLIGDWLFQMTKARAV
jgi:sporulation-control protein